MVMEFLGYIIVGLVSGVLGGMGLGGGTVLIPALTIFLKVNQLGAQALNLISFLPMAIISLIFHFKNKLVEVKGIWFIIIPAVIFAVLGAWLSSIVSSKWLGKAFGIFLVLLSIIQFISPKIKRKT